MKDTTTKLSIIERRRNTINNSPLIRSKLCLENKLNKKNLEKKENESRQMKSKFYKFKKDKENDDLNKPIREETFKKYCSFKEKKVRRNSVSQDLVLKILEINNRESFYQNDNSNFFLCKEAFPNNINSIRSNKISFNTNKEIPKISFRKGENNKIQ